jgi:choline dehydrogenase-like flavoprotein
MHIVIGSGPAGVACAMGLISRGEEVTMLDAGFALEPDIQSDVDQMSQQTPGQWPGASLRAIRTLANVGGAPRKLVYGSEYPYRVPEGYQQPAGKGVDFTPSFAVGGLSNVWGAAMLPYLQSDIDDWPIKLADLARYYPRVLEFVPLTGRIDDLAGLFPLYTDHFQEHRPSRQAQRFLAALVKHRTAFAQQSMTFGMARLAVHVSSRDVPCVYCGMCMFGCPYDLIYSSRHTLARLMQEARFAYKGGVIVERVAEKGNAVTVLGRSVTGAPAVFEGDRVFVAAGAVATTQIMMDSLGLNETLMQDSQYFLLPVLQLAGSHARREDLHTLAQLFLDIRDPEISPRTVHLQLYTYNEIYGLEFHRRFGPLGRLLPSGQILERMSLIQGFLHSDDSVKVRVIRRDSGLKLRRVRTSRPGQVINKVVRRLIRNSARLGAAPVLPMLKIELPGRSFHFGGTFPMSASPRTGQADTLGRLGGMERVHVVDSACFPSIPATTITFSVMANAYRIAMEHKD